MPVETISLPELPFFGREHEFNELHKALLNGTRIVEIVGPPGSGKSAFVRNFADTTQSQFLGGAEWFTGSPHFPLSEVTDLLAKRFRRSNGRHLLIIDEADRLDATDMMETIKRLETGPWQFSTVLTALRPLSLGPAISLHGLEIRDFAEYARSLFGDALDDADLAALRHATQGSPLVARLLYNIWRQERMPIDNLSRLLLPFDRSGLVDVHGQPLASDTSVSNRIIVDASAVNNELLRRAARDPALVFNISPREFEELIAELLHRRGYDVKLTPQTRDGGKDIYAAKRDDLGTFLYIVECKRNAPDNPVGVEVVRALHGVADVERVTGAMVMTTSYFSHDARELAAQVKYRMSLKNYLDLRQWLTTAQSN